MVGTDAKLANGWAVATVGQLSEIIRGISFPKDAKAYEPRDGYVACLRTANVQRQVEWEDLWFVPQTYVKSDNRFVRPLDVLISVSNSLELLGKVAQVTHLAQCTTLGAFISLLRPYNEIDAKLYYHFLASPDVQAKMRSEGSTTTNISNISSSKLSQIELSLPAAPRAAANRCGD